MGSRRPRAAAMVLAAGAAAAAAQEGPAAPAAIAASPAGEAAGPAPSSVAPGAMTVSDPTFGFGWPTLAALGLFGDALRERLSVLPADSGWRLALSLTTGLIATDNSSGSAQGRADTIVRMSAGLGLRYRGALVQGALDYRLSEYLYVAGTRDNRLSNDLSAVLRGAFFDRRLNVLASASIRRASTSAFVAQPVDDTYGGAANGAEQRGATLRAGWRSLLQSDLEFTANGALNVDDVQGAAFGDNVRTTLAARLGSPRDRRVSWEGLFDLNRRDSSSRAALHSERVRAGVGLNLFDWDARLSANAGVESSNMVSTGSNFASFGSTAAGGATVQRPVFGIQANWQPSRRTRAMLIWDRRAYRDSWDLSGEYRTPLNFVRLRYRSGVALFDGLSLQAADGDPTTGTVLNFLDAQLSSRVPDAAERLQQIGAFLVANGLDPSGAVNTAALTTTPTRDRVFSAIVGHEFGPRGNITLSLTHSLQTRLPGVLASLSDDFALTSRLRRTVVDTRFVYRLSPGMRATASLTLQQAIGDTAALKQQQQTLAAQVGGAGAYGGIWSFGARTSHIDNASGDFFVNAVFANLGWLF